MKTKLITDHPDYLLLVDTEARIMAGDDIYMLPFIGFDGSIYRDVQERPKMPSFKIIGHLPKNADAPLLEGVPLLVPLPEQGEDDTMYWLTSLCHYDRRNPDNVLEPEDEGWFPESGTTGDLGDDKCYCDNCFYGRTAMAEKHLDTRNRVTGLLQRIAADSVEVDGLSMPKELWKDLYEVLQSLSAPVVPVDFEVEYAYRKGDFISLGSAPGDKNFYHEEDKIKIMNNIIQGRWIFKESQ